MRRLLALTAFFLFSASVLAGFSSTNGSSMSRYEQRQLYREAINYIKSGQYTRYHNIRDQLTDYPLYPYLEYTEKIYRISRQRPEDIRRFMDSYSELPIADQLLENYIFVQAKQGNWARFLEFYSDRLTGDRNACFHAYALYREGRTEEAFEAARKLWLVDYSQPDECDPIFKIWRDAGQLDSETAWQRFSMALMANEVSLASYLMRYLAEEDSKVAENFKLVHRSPNYVKQARRFPADSAKNRDAIIHGIRRLARRDADAAFDTFGKYITTHSFEPAEVADTWSYIGIRLAIAGDENGLLDSLPVDMHRNEELIEARIRLALRGLEWGKTLAFLNVLPPDMQEEPRWQYWKARILADSRDATDSENARSAFEALAEQRNFYGFMSADILDLPYQFEDTPAEVTEDEILNLETTPGIQRALELFTLNERTRARREWYSTIRDFTDHELQIAARVAQKWGWYRQAIFSMIEAEAWNDLDVRFPLAYHDSFVTNARTWDIPLHWSFAIARQESAFMPDARSTSGAMGIMQLMPTTARLTANRHGVDLDSVTDLVEPGLNIRLGSAYLGQMLRRFNNNRVIASAAYNAGPSRVDGWLDPSLPLDVWVETIPFTETRNYVQNVLMFATIYARRLSQTQPLIYAHEQNDFSKQQITFTPRPVTPRPDNS